MAPKIGEIREERSEPARDISAREPAATDLGRRIEPEPSVVERLHVDSAELIDPRLAAMRVIAEPVLTHPSHHLREAFTAPFAGGISASRKPPPSPPASGSGPKLYAVLAYLSSAGGLADVQALQAKLAANGADFSARNDPPTSADPMPADPFERAVTRTVYGGFLHSNDVQEALPYAVASALAEVADANGVIDSSKLGLVGQSWLKQWTDHLTTAAVDLFAPGPSDEFSLLSESDLTKLARSEPADTVVPHMPLVADVSRLLNAATALAHFKVFALSDMQPSELGFVAGLKKSGASTAAIALLFDKRAGDGNTAERLVSAGYRVDDGGISDASISTHLAALFAGVDSSSTTRQFLLVDRNGQIAETLHRNFARFEHLCALVDSGTPSATTVLDAPIVGVASTPSLDTFRTAITGEATVFQIERALFDLNPAVKISPKTATIVGYDDLGASVAQSLRRRGYAVQVVANTPAETQRAKDEGRTVGTLDQLLPASGLLVGCSGNVGLTQTQLQSMPSGAVLTSARSQASAGKDAGFRNDPQLQQSTGRVVTSTFQGLQVVLGQASGALALSAIFRDGATERLILRSGYAMSMNTDVPPEFAQLNRSIALAGAISAVRAPSSGITALPEATQQIILTQALKQAGTQGISLSVPVFAQR